MAQSIAIGQLLIIGFDGTEMSPRLASLLTKIQPAGVILFARNIIGAEQTHALLRECQKCVATPLFTCVDLEGGTVDRFRNVLGAAPSPAEVLPRAGYYLVNMAASSARIAAHSASMWILLQCSTLPLKLRAR